MGLAPETAVSPVSQAPPDRPTLDLEQWARQGLALLFGDQKLDEFEMRVLREFMEEVQMRAMQAGGIGLGSQSAPQAAAQPGQLGPSPMEMNAETEDYGSGAGEPMDVEY